MYYFAPSVSYAISTPTKRICFQKINYPQRTNEQMNTTQKRLTIILTSLFLTLLLTRLTSGNLSTYGVTNQLRNTTNHTSEVSATTKIAPTSFKISSTTFPEKTTNSNQPLTSTFKEMSSANMYAQKPTSEGKKIFAGYYVSWCDKKNQDRCDPWNPKKPEELDLIKIAPYVNMVIVSFMKPNAVYTKGSYNLEPTGLEFSSTDGKIIRDAINKLKQKNPGTKVLISVGGYNFSNDGDFENLNPQAIADVVEDFGFDGVDICYEPHSEISYPRGKVQCSLDSNGKRTCNNNDLYRRTVEQVRGKLQNGKMLTVAAWSNGVYGEDRWKNSQPNTSPLTGVMLNLLQSPTVRLIDQLNVMSYEAGSTYNPQEALAAYQHYFKGPIVMGIQVPPDEWPQDSLHVYTIDTIRNLIGTSLPGNPDIKRTTDIKKTTDLERPADGIMLWYLQKKPGEKAKAQEAGLSAEVIAKEVCSKLALGNCDLPLFSK